MDRSNSDRVAAFMASLAESDSDDETINVWQNFDNADTKVGNKSPVMFTSDNDCASHPEDSDISDDDDDVEGIIDDGVFAGDNDNFFDDSDAIGGSFENGHCAAQQGHCFKGHFTDKTRLRVATCRSCPKNQAKCKTDTEMAQRAMMFDFNNYFEVNYCQRGCTRSCFQNVTLDCIATYRKDFWKTEPNRSERRVKIVDELKKASADYVSMLRCGAVRSDEFSSPFVFRIKNEIVCEKAFVNVIGMADINGFRLKTWADEMSIFIGDKQRNEVDLDKTKAATRSSKFEHAYAYIESVVDSEVVDKSAIQGQENSLYLPYRRVNYFFGEYDYFYKSNAAPEHAGESTFRRAYSEVVRAKARQNIHIKLYGGKGSFDQCEICHNAEHLLSRRKWSNGQRDIIKAYRRRHIEQQFAERLTLQKNISSTYNLDANGQPVTCLFFSDGMTVMKGNTPRKGARSAKGENSHITSRIIGVEVHCGPIHGTFLYYTDNLTSGGASIIVEIMKQSIIDLQSLLKDKHDLHGNSLDVPDHMILQFDNCSENKNKFVFAYLSLLVQQGHFALIEVFFLIVGHTHASIDQYFSILSKLIWRSQFIGSPLALEYLVRNQNSVYNMSGKSWENSGDAERKLKSLPLIVKKVSVVFELKHVMKPLINNKIKFYPIPHRFRFEKYHSVCAMQYTLFSSHQVLLPMRPEHIPDLEIEHTLDCEFNFLSLVGGESSFMRACGVEPGSQTMSLSNSSSLKVLNTLKSLADDFRAMEIKVISNILSLEEGSTNLDKYEAELKVINDSKATISKVGTAITASVADKLRKESTAERGLIMWLNPGVSCDIKPEPIHLRETVAFMRANLEYQSTGCDVYDLCHCDVDHQYRLIMEWLRMPPSTSSVTVSKVLNISATLNRLEDMFLLGPAVVDKGSSVVEERMKEIISTSTHVFDDIMRRKINAPDCEEFDFNTFNLARSEVVFYFHRLTIRGNYYILFKEFEKLINQPYSILPLVRPTRSNPGLVLDLTRHEILQENAVRTLGDELVQHKAGNIVEGRQVLVWDGCGRSTLNSANEPVLGIPVNITSAMSARLRPPGSNANKRRNPNCGRGEGGLSLRMSRAKILEVATSENVAVTTRMNKEDLIEAIELARQQTQPSVAVAQSSAS